MDLSIMLNCIGPGIRQLARLEGCDIEIVGFVPCVTYAGTATKELSIQTLSTLAGQDDYHELADYINTTCRYLKAEYDGNH